jgi:hypothetical protein
MPPFYGTDAPWWIYDATVPSNPVLVATFDYEYKGLPSFAMEWPDCYVAYYDGSDCWIDHIDFTNPTAPVLTEHVVQVISSAITVGGMTFDENYLHIAVNDGVGWWLVTYDITDFSNFNLYAHLGIADFPAFLDIMSVTGWTNTYLITAEYNDGQTYIFDITDPITTGVVPTAFSTLTPIWQNVGLVVRDDQALYLGFDAPVGKLGIVNVSPAGTFAGIPGPPVLLPSSPASMSLDHSLDRVYINNVFQGLTVVDFNAAPFVLNNEPFFQSLVGFGVEYADSNLVYITYLGWGGFEVIDVSDVGNFQTLYHSTAIDNPHDVVEQGDYLFVLDSDTVISGKATIKTVDISDPQNAEVVAEYWIAEGTNGPICLDGDLLAVTMPHGFKLIDVSNPLSLTTLFTYSQPVDNFFAVGIWNNYLFVGFDPGGAPPPYWIQTWDITNPAIPVAPPGPSGFAFAGVPLDLLFIGDAIFINRGVSLLSLSLNPDPLNPTPLGGLGPNDGFERMKIENNMLYVIDKWNLEIYDVTDPTVFAFQSEVAIPNNGVDIPDQLDVEGLFAFMSGSPLIESFNVWPATTPAYVGQVSPTEFFFSNDLLEYNGFLYQADVGKGIRIYDLY